MDELELTMFFRALADPVRDPVTFAASPQILDATDAYFSRTEDARRQLIDTLGKDSCLLLGRYVGRFCGDAIDAASPAFVLSAVMILEMSAAAVDWRMQLVRLLIVDHTLRRLESIGQPFDTTLWQVSSPGSWKAFLQLDERKSALRNIDSVELQEVVRNGHTVFVSNA